MHKNLIKIIVAASHFVEISKEFLDNILLKNYSNPEMTNRVTKFKMKI